MCGICGVYGLQFTAPERDLFQRLLLVNSFRGMDSTGVIKIRDKPRMSCSRIRAAISSPEFIFSKKGGEFISQTDSVIGMIGHTRAATKGSVTAKNAHPFEFPGVIGVHNGTIKYKFKGSDKYETDSEALYSLINEVGVEKALNEIGYADPAYALVFLDKKEGTLNFIRNSKRPLHFTFLYGRTTLAWSSTQEALEFSIKNGASTATQSGWESTDKSNPYFILKPHQLMSIKLGAAAHTAKITVLDIHEHVSAVTYSYGGSTMGGHTTHSAWIKGTDGNYRSADDERKRLAKINAEAAFADENQEKGTVDADTDAALDTVFGKGAGEYAGFRENGKTDLSLLPWLPSDDAKGTDTSKTSTVGTKTTGASSEAPRETPLRDLNTGPGTAPMSIPERDYKLSCGCFACSTVVHPDNATELNRVHWWNRDYYACGDCYEGSDGDWVRMTIEDDWPNEKTSDKTVH